MELSASILLLIIAILICLGWYNHVKNLKVQFKKNINNLDDALSLAREEAKKQSLKNQSLTEKYSPIIQAEAYSQDLLDEAELKASAIKQTAENLANEVEIKAIATGESLKEQRIEGNQKLRDAKEKAEKIRLDANQEADRITLFAEQRAKEIAGDAYEAKDKANTYEQAIKAMRNTIEGYKDDYIIPNHSVLDDLAEDFSHKEAGAELKLIRQNIRQMIKEGFAGDCDYVEQHRKTYAIHFVVDAFNGKVDSALSKVKHDNFGKINQEILDAFALVNHNGVPFRKARINQKYLNARLIELKWAVATSELKRIEREEQAEIKAQIREEEKALRDIEKAKKEVEKEERLLQKALTKAREELSTANDEQRADYEAKLFELEKQLKEAEEKGHRAMSMAQQTRRGHVYVISNVGSFGEEVFKIGMTRRLEPMDRVKELGDASVPFSFDVHAMIFSEDAPSLEKELHRRFDICSVNKINSRKEFFRTTISEVRQAVEINGIKNVHWTLKAEASEYRESLAIEKNLQCNAVA
jgi:hypothetical protein